MRGDGKTHKRFYEQWWFWLFLFAFVSVVFITSNKDKVEQTEPEQDDAIEMKETVAIEKEAQGKENPHQETVELAQPASGTSSDPSVYSNPVSKLDANKVKREIEEKAVHDWPDDYIMQDFQVEEQTKSYHNLLKLNIDSKVKEEILNKAVNDWPNDYTMVEFQYNQQVSAYEDVMDLKPADEAEKRVLENAKRDWPNDYEMIKYQYEEQLKAKIIDNKG
ncbi:hypothetical protein [Niallia sp. Krafla_26]|uniref:hypothetical protein n=1 Tax=Niallia sp. Krafla_26 TaxID=3064703 RepID=UPI003D16C2AC